MPEVFAEPTASCLPSRSASVAPESAAVASGYPVPSKVRFACGSPSR